MDKIKVLDKSTSELIAAGEVVERPASIVKELIENSIDACAAQISIEIKNGGKSFIKISDNGIGMSQNDVQTAFLRHATSKISTKDDLYRINTLGFRGEALCAIAIVSRCEVFTKQQQNEFGTKLKIDASKITSCEQFGCPNGTTIIVRDLFYNTPARLSFLKKETSEAAYIYDIIEKLALSHTEISFRLINNGKETFYSSGNGNLLELINALYGKAYEQNALKIKYEQANIKIGGYCLKPEISKASRLVQNVFINGRYIKNNIVTRALEAAYKNCIMVRRFPVAFLYLTIDPAIIDVNVHPTKLEVKFKNEKDVYDVVYYGIKEALDKNNGHFSFQVSEADKAKNESIFELYESLKVNSPEMQNRPETSILFAKDSQNSSKTPTTQVWKVEKPRTNIDIEITQDEINQINKEQTKIEKIQDKIEQVPKEPATTLQLEPEQIEIAKKPLSYKVIGEVFDSFIIVEQEDKMLLIDKHAGHERILYEELLLSNTITEQVLLAPISLVMSKVNCDIAISNKEKLLQYGFSIDYFGDDDIIVRSVPSILAQQNIEDVLEEIIVNLKSTTKDIKTTAHENILHSIACKAAIKAGSFTSAFERDNFVLKLLGNPDIKYCPHGRPIVTEISKKEIEKMFKRI